jgi:tetratricopeptide (TPR) repeat protein
MPIATIRLDLPGSPSLIVDLSNGTVVGLDEILPLLTDANTGDRIGQELYAIGEAFENSGQGEAACKIYQSAVRVVQSAGSRFNFAVIINSLGIAYKHVGRLIHAAQCYEKAIELLERPFEEPFFEQRRLPSLANSLACLAIVSDRMNDKATMNRCATRALEIALKNSDQTSVRVLKECRELLNRGGP